MPDTFHMENVTRKVYYCHVWYLKLILDGPYSLRKNSILPIEVFMSHTVKSKYFLLYVRRFGQKKKHGHACEINTCLYIVPLELDSIVYFHAIILFKWTHEGNKHPVKQFIPKIHKISVFARKQSLYAWYTAIPSKQPEN